MKSVRVATSVLIEVPLYLQEEAELLKNECVLPILRDLSLQKAVSSDGLYEKVKKSLPKLSKKEFSEALSSLSKKCLTYKIATKESSQGSLTSLYKASSLGSRLLFYVDRYIKK